ncbi:IS21 family transposase, partial [Candidatus Bathyarchaeota archaeon]|nr:IS21 family transposase [Candidatus Bathyarchaeota archaeon]
WVEADRQQPRKQRHTGTRIYERLRDEYGFTGSVSAVRRYLAQRKQTQGEVFFPLQFDAGEEGQVDWGEAWCILNGVEQKVFLFCLRLCYSSVSYVCAYPQENQECFQDGHVHAFGFFGGVPHQLAYDNLKSAVITVGQGQDRRLNLDFVKLRSHYLFETRFCNVASGNEKGHVENLVKHSQRTFMTPLPCVSSLEALNTHLEEQCRKELDKKAPRREETRGALLEEERSHFLELPPTPFAACRQQSTFASKQATVRFDTNDYSLPVRWAYHSVQVKGFVNWVEIWTTQQCVATHSRSYERHQYVLDPFHYIPLLEKKPGGIHHGRPFKGEPWGEDFACMRRELEYRYEGEGTRKYIDILLLFTCYPVEAVRQAVSLCVKRRAFSDEAVHSILDYQPPSFSPTLDLSDRPDFQVESTGIRPAHEYDVLLPEEGVS